MVGPWNPQLRHFGIPFCIRIVPPLTCSLLNSNDSFAEHPSSEGVEPVTGLERITLLSPCAEIIKSSVRPETAAVSVAAFLSSDTEGQREGRRGRGTAGSGGRGSVLGLHKSPQMTLTNVERLRGGRNERTEAAMRHDDDRGCLWKKLTCAAGAREEENGGESPLE